MVGLKQDFLFDFDILHLVLLEHDVFVESLHCVDLASLGMLHKEHFAE